ncbi:MAG: hypothetical protein JSV35_05990, partial [Candidatus Bathyarchaeota archaeon]
LSEVLDVLSKISDDLRDIASSLRKAKSPEKPPIRQPASIEPTTRSAGTGIEDVRMMFSSELEELLIFEDKGSFIKVTPRQYLGSDNFAKIASAIRESGGEYISAGRDSHFRIPK